MNCRAFHDFVQQRLDGVVAEPPDGFDEHRRACPACAALDGAAGRLAEGLRLLAPPAPPPDLAARVAARVARKRLARPRRRRRVVVPLAVAACLLVAIGTRLWWSRPPAGSRPGAEPGPVTKKQEPPADPVDLRESVAEAGEAVVSLTSRTAGEAVDRTRWLWPEAPPTPTPAPPREPPARALREAGAGLSAGLDPMTDSARRAVDLFLRDLPPLPEEDQVIR
jgi:hypothetical protein